MMNDLHRKLGPVYDAIDAFDFKQALKLCEKLPQVSLVKALKAHCLEKRNRTDEALALVKEVMQELGPNTDEQLIQTVYSTLRATGCDHDIVDLYAKGVETLPTKLEIHESLMFSYLREYRFGEMQSCGLQLAKKFQMFQNNVNYLSWVGCIMLANSLMTLEKDPKDEQAKRSLGLAEAMMRKALQAENDKGEQPDVGEITAKPVNLKESIVLVLVDILQYQDKLDAAIEVVNGELATLANREKALLLGELHMKNAKVHDKTESLKLASEHFADLVTNEDPDDWRNWCGFLEASVEWNEKNNEGGGIDILQKIDSLRRTEKGKPRRAPHLAHVMFQYRQILSALASTGTPDESLEKQLLDSVFEYLKLFSEHACCFGDLHNFLAYFVLDRNSDNGADIPAQPPSSHPIYVKSVLGRSLCDDLRTAQESRVWSTDIYCGLGSETARKGLIEYVEDLCKNANEQLSSSMEDINTSKLHLRTIIVCHQVLMYVGHYDTISDEEVINVVLDGLLKLYKATIHFDDGAPGGDRAVKVGDDLVLLIALLTKNIFYRKCDDLSILKALAAFLEDGYRHSPNAFQLGLALIEIYGRLDCIPRLSELFMKLDIKHIQIDSLTYLALGSTHHAGFFDVSMQLCQNMEYHWNMWRYDNPKHVKMGCKKGNLVQVLDFIRLDRRLLYSHQRFVGMAEGFQLGLIKSLEAGWNDLCAFVKDQCTERAPEERFRGGSLAEVRQLMGAKFDPSQASIDDLSCLEENLLPNYDFDVRVSWDCPVGITVSIESKEVEKARLPAYPPTRGATASPKFLQKWYRKASLWMATRVTIGEILLRLTHRGDDAKFGTVLVEKLKAYISALGSADCKMWDGVFLVMTTAFDLIEADEPSLIMESCSGKLETAIQSMQEHKSEHIPTDVVNPILLAVITTRALMDIVPKPKKKKKKANPTKEEQDREQLQKTIKSCSTTIIDIMTHIETVLKELRDAPPVPNNDEIINILQLANEESVSMVERHMQDARVELHSKQLGPMLEIFKAILKSAKY